MWLWLVLPVVVVAQLSKVVATITDGEPTTSEPRWLREILRDTDLSLSSILSEPVDSERVDFAFQFLLGYKGLLERLIAAARARDPRTIEVLRDLEHNGGRPSFMQQLPGLSVRQDHFKWKDEDLDLFRTQILEINKLVEEFKSAVIELTLN